ncbi:endonuclease III [Candidatus Arthromitus sp. SFB-mouse-Japan]|uniref:endonuclease III n=1 Tax=unclassified Candidatus Neoarthromitus TaxID=2638829 RepID=UPI00021B80F9|nr:MULTISPECIES: endonuclease III [unclassified Candidatus Arthromitus]EIA29370.1 Endonuclease III [Candidatus Arthromitus sp. SFB-co]EIA30084.1 Endonuclease III [Candidatus Arthromitus sp. SFB-mouse-SU]AID45277.1 Endonuclease III [Candidatus Arthromitus sp. SFB-mouse-NL]EGX28252.1 endonuclease III [Candidatus Arthromitus sp. SFB-mouse-NYU]BAK57067.1 endonuclease III [Candidatus Arthromitus sp. SFB-mouse-Japan]
MKKKFKIIVDKLIESYPDARCELEYKSPFQLLIATVLSAQTTDKKVNEVTKNLFIEYPRLEDFLKLDEKELQDKIKSIGLYRMKSKNIINLCRILEERFDSEVPRTRDELITLPGVGRKTANVVISNCFGVQAFAVDVHVFRVSNRIGIANSPTPEKTELDLMKNIDENLWTICHHTIIFHGRRCCTSRKPNCGECKISEYCKYYKQNN